MGRVTPTKRLRTAGIVTAFALVAMSMALVPEVASADETAGHDSAGLRAWTDESDSRLPDAVRMGVRAGHGDFDGDGDMDIVVANGAHSSPTSYCSNAFGDFALLINDGTGSFENGSIRLPESSRGTYQGAAAVVGDVDRDGDLDIFAVFGTSGYCGGTDVRNRLWINDGNGWFTDETDTRLPGFSDQSWDAAFGDVNGDGWIDILVGNVGYSGNGSQNRLLLNAGGVFIDATDRLPTRSEATTGVSLGDIDGDGDLDAVIGNTSRWGSRLLINDLAEGGVGALHDESSRLAPRPGAQDVSIDDVDGDGQMDIVFAGYTSSGTVMIMINDGSQFVWEPSRVPAAAVGSHGIDTADVDQDSDMDVLVSIPSRSDQILLLNDGSGTFSVAPDCVFAGRPATVRHPMFVDVTGDGYPDAYLPTDPRPLSYAGDLLFVNNEYAVTVDPGGPYLVETGGSIQLDGSGSGPCARGHSWSITDGSGFTADGISATYSPTTTTQAGVFPIELTVTGLDDQNHSAVTYVVVYDPSSGHVTGGGSIESPAGAYVPDSAAIGRATFGFVSRYHRGASAPEGQTEFRFRAGDLSFHSWHQSWLVVSGSGYAMFKGTGYLDSDWSKLYQFRIWAGDGTGANGADTFRIKIWTETADGEAVVYDNGMDQAISGGNIVVHS